MTATPDPGIVFALAASMADMSLAADLEIMARQPGKFDRMTRAAVLIEAAKRLSEGSYLPAPKDVVTVMGGSRQFDVLDVSNIDRLAKIDPRCPDSTTPDFPRWISYSMLRKVSADKVEPYEED